VFLYCAEFFAILWGKKKEKSLNNINKDFFENNYPNFPDFDLFFFLIVRFLPSAIVGSQNIKVF
jgi:hypothetical protein